MPVDPQYMLFLILYFSMLCVAFLVGTLPRARWWPGFLVVQWYAIALALSGHAEYGALSLAMALWWPRSQTPAAAP